MNGRWLVLDELDQAIPVNDLSGCRREISAGLLADCGKALPFIEKAIFTREKEQIPFWNKFLQGYYDFSGISSDSFDQAIQTGSNGEANLTEDMQKRGIQLGTSVSM